MAVTFDNVASTYSTGTSLAFNLTATVGVAALVVITSGGSVSAMTYANVALTKKGSNNAKEFWVLSAPSSGNNVLSANFVDGSTIISMIGATYTNAATANTFGTEQDTLTTGTVANLSLSSTTIDLMVMGYWVNDGGATAITFNNAGSTMRASVSTGAGSRIGIWDVAGASILSISASTTTSTGFIIFGIPIVAAASGGKRRNICLMNVGA